MIWAGGIREDVNDIHVRKKAMKHFFDTVRSSVRNFVIEDGGCIAFADESSSNAIIKINSLFPEAAWKDQSWGRAKYLPSNENSMVSTAR